MAAGRSLIGFARRDRLTTESGVPLRRGYRRGWVDDEVVIDAPLSEIHALIADVRGWVDWVPGLPGLRVARSGDVTVGRRFAMKLAMPPLPVFWVPCQMFAVEEHYIEWGGGIPGTTIAHRFEFALLPDGRTRVRHVEYATNFLAVFLIPVEKVFIRHDQRWTRALQDRWRPDGGTRDLPTAAPPPR